MEMRIYCDLGSCEVVLAYSWMIHERSTSLVYRALLIDLNVVTTCYGGSPSLFLE